MFILATAAVVAVEGIERPPCQETAKLVQLLFNVTTYTFRDVVEIEALIVAEQRNKEPFSTRLLGPSSSSLLLSFQLLLLLLLE